MVGSMGADSNGSELERRVDEVLYYVWDPIGVSDEPYARSEYRMYVDQVMKALSGDNPESGIVTTLLEIETKRMDLKANSERALTAAQRIIEHKRALEDGCG